METTTAEDRSLWRQFAMTTLTLHKPLPKPKARANAKAKAKRSQKPPADRLAALEYLKALDQSLDTVTGRKLSEFRQIGAEDHSCTMKLSSTMSVVIDQGSDGWSLMFYLLYKQKLRFILKFDIYHREHNDVMGAVKASGMWGCCVLSGMVHNVNYGPWEGSAWFQKILKASIEYFALAGPDDALFKMFISDVARDKGMSLEDFETLDEAVDEIFAAVRDGSCFRKKGFRTAFRRFFSWYQAHNWHDQHWHARLMMIIYIGLRQGVYTSISTLPTETRSLLFAAKTADDAADGDEDAEEPIADLGEVHAVVAAEEKDGAADRGDCEVKEPVSKGGHDELKRLRATCQNSLHVAGAILGRPGLQESCRMIWCVGKPFYDQHSEHARSARGVEGVKEYYLQAALGSVLEVCHTCAMVTRDLDTLQLIGFDTSSAPGMRKSSMRRVNLQDPMLIEDNVKATKLMTLVLNHIRFRTNSMSWHSDDLPGIAGLWLSDEQNLHTMALDFLVSSFFCFLEAQRRSAGNTFLKKVVDQSAFQTVFVREMAEFAVAPSILSTGNRLQKLRAMAEDAFGGLGQTKIVEDVFKIIRDREVRDTATKAVKLQRQMHIAFNSDTIADHKFLEPDLNLSKLSIPPVPKDLFWCETRTPTVDPDTLTGPRTWPSLKPLHYSQLAAQNRLLQHISDQDLWHVASSCWQTQLLPLGTVFRKCGGDSWVVSLGSCALTAVRSYPLDRFVQGQTEFFFLAEKAPTTLPWEFCLQIDTLEVVPTQIVAPRHSLVVQDKGTKINTGVCFLKAGAPVPVYHYAAMNAFWQLPKYVIDKVAALYGVARKQAESTMLDQLLRIFFPDALDEDIWRMMGLRGLTPYEEELDEQDLPESALEGLVPESDKKDVQDVDFARQEYFFCCPGQTLVFSKPFVRLCFDPKSKIEMLKRDDCKVSNWDSLSLR